MKLHNKTVFITGGAKRIGLELCKYFFENGANLAMHYNSSEAEAQTLQKQFGDRCKTFKADLTNTQIAVNCFKEALSHFGKIEFLINNASVFKPNLIANITEEEFDRDFAIHLKTPLFLMQEFAKQDFKNEEGLILNILDKNVVRKNTSFISYLLSKKSLDELTRFSAFEFAPKIRVNSISPGFILPEESTSQFSSTKMEEYMQNKFKNIPLKRMGSPKDVIKTVDFFINSSYINGVNIPVDGGSFVY